MIVHWPSRIQLHQPRKPIQHYYQYCLNPIANVWTAFRPRWVPGMYAATSSTVSRMIWRWSGRATRFVVFLNSRLSCKTLKLITRLPAISKRTRVGVWLVSAKRITPTLLKAVRVIVLDGQDFGCCEWPRRIQKLTWRAQTSRRKSIYCWQELKFFWKRHDEQPKRVVSILQT